MIINLHLHSWVEEFVPNAVSQTTMLGARNNFNIADLNAASALLV